MTGVLNTSYKNTKYIGMKNKKRRTTLKKDGSSSKLGLY